MRAFLLSVDRCNRGMMGFCRSRKPISKSIDNKIAIYYTSTIPNGTQTKEQTNEQLGLSESGSRF